MSGDDLELHLAWQQHLGDSRAAAGWFDDVVARHRSTGRHYHGVRHVRWVVRHIGSFPDLDDVGAVIAAAFFHDVVYDATAQSGENEAASADLAAAALRELDWSAARIARVTSMIRATAGHRVPSVDIDHDALLAADLAVLAAEPGRYGDYVRGVRREYAHLDDDAWAAGRTAVLRGFLERERLFSPRLALDSWEQRARANITAELAALSG